MCDIFIGVWGSPHGLRFCLSHASCFSGMGSSRTTGFWFFCLCGFSFLHLRFCSFQVLNFANYGIILLQKLDCGNRPVDNLQSVRFNARPNPINGATEMAEPKQDKLAILEAKKAKLEEQMKKIQDAEKKKEKALAEKRLLAVGKLAQQAGILDKADAELLEAFKRIASA